MPLLLFFLIDVHMHDVPVFRTDSPFQFERFAFDQEIFSFPMGTDERSFCRNCFDLQVLEFKGIIRMYSPTVRGTVS